MFRWYDDPIGEAVLYHWVEQDYPSGSSVDVTQTSQLDDGTVIEATHTIKANDDEIGWQIVNIADNHCTDVYSPGATILQFKLGSAY